MKVQIDSRHGIPESFLARFGENCTGVLSGFDRLRFRGSLRTLQDVSGMMAYLYAAKVKLVDFSTHVNALTLQVREHAKAMAEAVGQKVQFLRSHAEHKFELAEQELERRGGAPGLVAIYSALEPCRTFSLHRDAERRRLELQAEAGKCLHLYFYFLHELYGLMHLRLQTWFPFTVQVWLNGRRWLARLMEQAGLGFVQQQNCFTYIEDVAAAQRLSDQQLETDWPGLLDGMLRQCHPLAGQLCATTRQPYYWSLSESEYATDVMFRSPAALKACYPRFLHHGIAHFGSQDVLRFLGSQSQAREVHGKFGGEIYTTWARRPEGVCLKHHAAGNSIKMYNKEGSVLRVESTLDNPRFFKVLRPLESAPEQPLCWQKLRKGVADTHRRAELGRAANRRYLEALAAVSSDQPAGTVAQTIFRPRTKQGRRARALNPWSKQDGALLEAIAAGEWTINGFRNRDVRAALFGSGKNPAEAKRLAARTTRLLALLRIHGLIQKIPKTHRYQVTAKGRQIITALQAARRASIEKLSDLAA